ncbi:MAG: hypothetical protein LC655_06985 [Bacteroidales bacterium]|nr:hypothetical protein [Bacteroidales bacterium]
MKKDVVMADRHFGWQVTVAGSHERCKDNVSEKKILGNVSNRSREVINSGSLDCYCRPR